jgi:hypothetical protein
VTQQVVEVAGNAFAFGNLSKPLYFTLRKLEPCPHASFLYAVDGDEPNKDNREAAT